jgi:nucleoside 2-deoxyribosyltransferase
MKKIYLAGPDVFRADPAYFFEQVKSLISKYGFIGIPPLDSGIELDNTEINSVKGAYKIFIANIDIINQCDVIFANLTPFRGPSIDDGTAFEIGYGFSKSKVIYGYSQDKGRTLKQITEESFPKYVHQDYPIIEDFQLGSNLMIEQSIVLSGGKVLRSLEDCLKDLKSK